MRYQLGNMDGIQARLLLLILMAALPGFLLTLIMVPRTWNLYEANAKQEALQLLQQTLLKKYILVDDTENLLKRLSTEPAVTGAPADCNAFMAVLYRQYPFYTTIGVANRNGKVICSAVPPVGNVEVSDRGWFQQAIRKRDFATGKYKIGRITNLPILSFGYPVIDATDAVNGVVFASLNLAYINDLIASEQLPPGTTVSIIDREGTILVHSPKGSQWVGKSIRNTPLFGELKSSQGKLITVESIDSDGVSRIFALGRLFPRELPDLSMVIGIPEQNIQAQTNRELLINLSIVSLVTLLALAIASWYSQEFIQRPIARLQTATQQMATGDLQVRVSPPYGTGQLGQLAVAFNDMAATLERHIEERAAVQKERERAELELRFVSVVSHELRAPLSTLRMIAELLDTFGEDLSEERKQFYLQQLSTSVNQMAQLMNDVLLIRRAEAENLEIRSSPFDLVVSCGDLIKSLQVGMNPERAIALSCQGDCAHVCLDETLARSILTNLLTNAIKYSSPESTVSVDVSCTTQTVVIQVRDQGIGIPAANQARLFEMFYRAENVGDITGTGLGLAIVKRFVDLLQGEITIDSTVGVGTTVRVTLPMTNDQ